MIRPIIIYFSMVMLVQFGSLLNKLVMGANGGKMPVLMRNEAARALFQESHHYTLMMDSSYLQFLGDWLYLYDITGSPEYIIVSAGDVLMILGFLGAVACLFWIVSLGIFRFWKTFLVVRR